MCRHPLPVGRSSGSSASSWRPRLFSPPAAIHGGAVGSSTNMVQATNNTGGEPTDVARPLPAVDDVQGGDHDRRHDEVREVDDGTDDVVPAHARPGPRRTGAAATRWGRCRRRGTGRCCAPIRPGSASPPDRRAPALVVGEPHQHEQPCITAEPEPVLPCRPIVQTIRNSTTDTDTEMRSTMMPRVANHHTYGHEVCGDPAPMADSRPHGRLVQALNGLHRAQDDIGRGRLLGGHVGAVTSRARLSPASTAGSVGGGFEGAPGRAPWRGACGTRRWR